MVVVSAALAALAEPPYPAAGLLAHLLGRPFDLDAEGSAQALSADAGLAGERARYVS